MTAVTALVACALVACGSSSSPAPHADAPGDCLPLRGALRQSLVADPKGGLLWLERVDNFDFDHNYKPTMNLVRFDFATRRVDTLLDHVSEPIVMLGDNIVITYTVGKSTWLVLVDRDRHVQSLLPEYLAAVDVEPIDDQTLAVLADGDGPRAVYTIELARPRPHHLIDADVLLSTWAGRVLTRTDDAGVVIAPDGQRGALALPPDATHPQGQDAYYVAGSVVHVRRMIGGSDRVVVGDHDTWQLINQPGAIIAFSQPAQNRSVAYVLASNAARPLPIVLGGGAILGVARVQAQTWALIGHNTANYNGNLVDSAAETDVCMLPATGTVSFATRSAPKRFADKAALAQAAKPAGSTLQILDSADLVPTVYVELPEAGGSDYVAMWSRARALHHSITSLLGDREMRTELHYSDGRAAVQRWRRDRLRERAVAGIGDALVSDPADFDLDVRDLVDKRDRDRIVCSGTFVNRTARAFDHVDVRCIAGDRINVIAIPHIAPNTSVHFEHAFVVEDAGPFFEVVAGREPLEINDVTAEARLSKLLELVLAVHDELQLSLSSHAMTANRIDVRFDAPASFGTRNKTELTDLAKRTYATCAPVRGIYEQPKAELVIAIAIDHGATYDFDGETLTPE